MAGPTAAGRARASTRRAARQKPGTSPRPCSKRCSVLARRQSRPSARSLKICGTQPRRFRRGRRRS
eukprot:9659849-Lingulodinium_polyedra.AAC.1